jgi:DNA-binding NtrC family response regulator
LSDKLLIVEDEETLRESLGRLFEKAGYEVETAGSAEDGLKKAKESAFDVVISDILLPGIDGIDMLTRFKESDPKQIFLIMTAYASLDTAVRALRAGAYDYIMKPVMHAEIKQVVHNALRERRLQRENVLLKREIKQDYDFSSIVGNSASLNAVKDEVKLVADSTSNVLILGETGTGKELIARVIHANSSRRDMPFVPINCSAIPEQLIESELFGHVRGSFTGAVANKTGLFEEADGGTVFLDEIGNMPKSFQVKLLRVIEDLEIRMVGSTRVRKVDIRIISATNLDLKQAVSDGEFREDLFYRVNVITVDMPSLKQRQDDIPALCRHFVEEFSMRSGKPGLDISGDAVKMLTGYAWPGNIRELKNVIERAVLICDKPLIGTEHLTGTVHNSSSFLEHAVVDGLSIDDYTRSFVSKYQDSLGEQELADKLGITRKTLWEKRKKWGLKRA